MRIRQLRVRGFRGFNEEQVVALSDPIAIFEGPNGSGKTSIGEAIEWLLYGRTLKRTKGDELSRREYDGSYCNIHFIGPGEPFVELEVQDLSGKDHKIRRELRQDETSVLQVDGKLVTSLGAFGINTLYDRPLILQHTLQDFIFMRPKARYEVLTAMLGLEPLIAFRNAVEAAKIEFNKKLPQKVREAESRRTLLLASLRQEAVLIPVVKLVEAKRLSEAKQRLDQIAQGLVAGGTPAAEVLNALKTAKATKERAKLDLGRYAGTIINTPTETSAIRLLSGLDNRVDTIRQCLADATAITASPKAATREQDPQRRQFYQIGLRLLYDAHLATCPFCTADSLTPQRLAAIREAVSETPEGQSALDKALAEVRAFMPAVLAQSAEVKRLVASLPEGTDMRKIRDIGGAAASAFLESNAALVGHLSKYSVAFDHLDKAHAAIEAALSTGIVSGGEDLAEALAGYRRAVEELPAPVNAYAANYNVLDPTIRAGLASAEEVRKLDQVAQAVEHWKAIETAQEYRTIHEGFQELIRETRAFTGVKQKAVLASRDVEIRNWYAMLNPVSDVAYDGIKTSTDNLELRARTYAKSMTAAPNLSTNQLNCIGLAVYLACATRKGTPFRTIVIDDPVQSMDDEHNEAFKKQVVGKLLRDGYHIVLLTHMQPLAGDVEALYRKQGAALFKMRPYSRSGPTSSG